MNRIHWCAGLVLASLLASGGLARADVKLPKVLASNMVLQQKQAIPIWGTADAGEDVTVSIGDNKATAKAGADGKWSVKLKELAAGGGPVEVVVKGKNEIKLTNVLIGEVWVASGQSNMEWNVANSVNPKEEIAAAKYPNIRLFHVRKTPAVVPQEVVLDRDWSECSPETISNFSAVAYFFGRHLHKELNVPIGLINTSWGGTAIEPWTPIAGFESVESLKPIAEQVKAQQAKPEGAKAGAGGPSHLYNGMVHHLVPFGIRGAIWYQGESNRSQGVGYEQRMHALINGWRSVWGQGDFPFLYVQLAPWKYVKPPMTDPAHLLPQIWEAQTKVLAMKNTGMAITHDIGNLDDIHPRNKQDVGKRLALWALAKTYGKSDLVYSGPLYKSMKVDGNKVRIEFDHVGGGLKSRDDKPLSWFTIAGKEGDFVEATATIDGNSIVVSSAKIAEPAAVRFGWDQLAEPNLMNAAGLPAGPFRTSR
ncbi:MAG: sialate O-acetylesterase [Planctomycetota bacterium]|nr:MAG: sialate O-acetylesterase [Planctomycetota bacterium]